MTAPLAVKMPPLRPGEFRFTTKALVPDTTPEGKRRFRTIASSTVVDMKGDEMKLSALEDMRDAFRRGVNMYLNHSYEAPKDSFGMSDGADIRDSGERDPKTGAPIYDLHVEGFVDEANPLAVQLHDSMAGGMRWGTSVGAVVTKHQRNKAGGLDIDHVDLKEGSIVGIPMNQRSWVQKAAKAVNNLEDAAAVLGDDEESDEEAPVSLTEAAAAGVNGTTVTNGTASLTDVAVIPIGAASNNFDGAPITTGETATVIVAKADACPKCGKGHEADGCDDNYHTKSVEKLPEADADAPTTETTDDDGQEAEVATPETAQEAEGATPEPATDIPLGDPVVTAGLSADVVELVRKHVPALVTEIGRLREENAALRAENVAIKSAAEVNRAEIETAREVIEKVMEQPLRAKTAGYVDAFVDKFPQFDPEIARFIHRASKES